MLRVDSPTDAPPTSAVLAGLGPVPPRPRRARSGTTRGRGHRRGGVTRAATDPHPGAGPAGVRASSRGDALVDVAARPAGASCRMAGALALEALRIAAWRPRFAREVDARSIPHELDWLRSAVHLARAATAARRRWRRCTTSGARRAGSCMLHLDGSEAVLPGPRRRRSLDGDHEVGSVTSRGAAPRARADRARRRQAVACPRRRP